MLSLARPLLPNRISEIVGNTIFSNFDTLLSQGQDMDYIARHYNMVLEKGDQAKRIMSMC